MFESGYKPENDPYLRKVRAITEYDLPMRHVPEPGTRSEIMVVTMGRLVGGGAGSVSSTMFRRSKKRKMRARRGR